MDLVHIEVYLDDFIGVIQGVPSKQTQMNHQLFRSIDDFFRLNNPQDRAREDPISLNKLAKGDENWSSIKTVLS